MRCAGYWTYVLQNRISLTIGLLQWLVILTSPELGLHLNTSKLSRETCSTSLGRQSILRKSICIGHWLYHRSISLAKHKLCDERTRFPFLLKYSPFTMTIRKYSPASEEVRLVDMSAAEYGLVQKWLFAGLRMEAFLNYNNIKTNEAKKPMHFQQIWLPLLCCMVIWAFSGCIFLWEHTSTLFRVHWVYHNIKGTLIN